jgi:hypothetical protein
LKDAGLHHLLDLPVRLFQNGGYIPRPVQNAHHLDAVGNLQVEDQVMPNRKAEQAWGRLMILGILIRQLSLGLFPARLGNDLFHVHRLGPGHCPTLF